MAVIERSGIFATAPTGSKSPDSVTLTKNSLWIEYGNGADSTGAGGSSTIVQYSLSGMVEHTYTISGLVDGLKVNPNTGKIYAFQNQDGNATLSIISPGKGTISGPLSYAVPSSGRGYDDAAFLGGQVYVSYTNPANPGDPVLQVLANGNMPMGTLTTNQTILALGATGYDISTGKADQPIPLSDPDSLKTTPDGRLILTSSSDNSFTLISNPGTKAQSEQFVQLTNLPTGSALDDVIIPTSSSGTFYVANAGTNQIQSFKVSGLNTSDAYASVGTEIVQVDLQTGAETPLITGLTGSHGLAFKPIKVAGPVVESTKIFALGSEAYGATKPDSVTLGNGSVWIEYGNNADSTGLLPHQGSSTIVEYSPLGKIEHTFSLPGSIDGLKYNPTTGEVWALKNQDGNSFLYLIDPKTNSVSGPLSYAPPYAYGTSPRGYDDVAFDNGRVFLSYTAPSASGDSVIQELDNGNTPSGKLYTTSILRLGDTGTNLVTGQHNQSLPVADPDSLKTLSDGSLILTSDHDKSLTIISHPGTFDQSESFVTLPAGSSGLDDAIMPTAHSGTFIIANGGANDVLQVKVSGLITHDIYVSVGSDNAIDQLDPTTGALTPFITGLNSPHGFSFIPSTGSAFASDLLPGTATAASAAASANATAPQHATSFGAFLAELNAATPAPVHLTQHA